jgi:ferritin-like metal-binding protein YciE
MELFAQYVELLHAIVNKSESDTQKLQAIVDKSESDTQKQQTCLAQVLDAIRDIQRKVTTLERSQSFMIRVSKSINASTTIIRADRGKAY